MPKHVLITGGSRGIGSAMVRAFSSVGYRVSFTYHSSREAALSLERETGAKAYSVDFANTEEVIRFAKSLDPVNVLVNNAGIAHYGLFQDTSLEDFNKLFSVDFQSAFFLTKELVPAMISSQFGVIINVSSVWGETGGSCEVLYSAAKGAMISFTKALAKELALSGITVNCISPGVVDTAMMSRFSQDEKEELMSEIPSGRFVDADEIASLALFLANHPSTSLTGQIIGVNGGMYC